MAGFKSMIVEKSYVAFFIITVVLGGGAAFFSGQALARSWKPMLKLMIYMMLLGFAVRFLHWGVFLDATYQSWRDMQGTLMSVQYYVVDTLVLMISAAFAYRLERTRQMTTQYHWLYERTSLLTWRNKIDTH
jgi:O-antigen/teichoic acid export membrane protein